MRKIVIAIAFFLILVVGGAIVYFQPFTPGRATAPRQATASKTVEKPHAPQPPDKEDIKLLEDRLNSRTIEEQATAFVPELEAAYLQQVKPSEPQGVVDFKEDTVVLIDESNATVKATVPKSGTQTIGLHLVKGQWLITVIAGE